MNRRIAAWTITTVAVLGLTACSGSPSASDDAAEEDTSNSAPAEETTPDQSVADACAIVIPKVTEASTAMSSIDTSTVTTDPQATVDQFTTFVDALADAADSVDNAEVKGATTAVYEDFVALSDILSKVLIDQDLEAASDMSTITTDMTESATALQELCS